MRGSRLGTGHTGSGEHFTAGVVHAERTGALEEEEASNVQEAMHGVSRACC